MPWLEELLPEANAPEVEVASLSWDSRRVRPGDLFFALPGKRVDGRRFAQEAVAKGAVAVVAERPIPGLSVPCVAVPNARAAMAQAAAAFYNHPTQGLVAIGVTGTNGKTTVVHLLGQLLPRCETLTTVRVEEEGLSCVTTPEAPDLQRIAAQALSSGQEFFAFEASSIGLAQHRVDGVHLRCAVFTGLSRDHLDFHGTMEAYREAKLRLFRLLPPQGVAVVNARSPEAEAFVAVAPGPVLSYGIGVGNVQAQDLRPTPEGMRFTVKSPWGCDEAFMPFPGRHNAENALAALTVGLGLGFPLGDLLGRLAEASLPPGRFARFLTARGAVVVVDFAHNPEAMEQMLREIRPQAHRLVVVFGCPGDADRGKREVMGEIAGRYADFVIITSDNPKSEDPKSIACAIAKGVERACGRFTIVLDRALAVELALEGARSGDWVLIAGKGHERFQHLAFGAMPYSDLHLVQELLGASGL